MTPFSELAPVKNMLYLYLQIPVCRANSPSKLITNRPPAAPPSRKSYDRFPAFSMPEIRERGGHTCHAHTMT